MTPLKKSFSGKTATLVFSLLSSTLFTSHTQAQSSLPQPPIPAFFTTGTNMITSDSALYPLFSKLQQLEQTRQGRVSIVQIGDSHLQDGELANAIRTLLQQRFGDAGRGIIFPYRLAKTNSPEDIHCSSATPWQHNSQIHPKNPVPAGIAGYGLETTQNNVAIEFTQDNTDADTVAVFYNSSHYTGEVSVSTPGNNTPQQLPVPAGNAPAVTALTPASHSFTVHFAATGNTPLQFYGVSVTRKTAGIVYHSIGVNSTQLSHYLQNNLFFSQLPALQADVYIVSLGTNESDNTSLTGAALEDWLGEFYSRLKQINPEALLLVTTPASSLHNNTAINKRIALVRDAQVHFAAVNQLPCWDLFTLSGGNSAWQWKKNHLLSRDGVHYTGKAYHLQGTLFATALLQSYDRFIHPAKTVDK